MLLYWHTENDGFATYSIDMLRFDFTVSESSMEYILRQFERVDRSDIENYGLSTSPFKYRHLFKINYEYSSMIVGIGFNGITKLDALKCFVELNPNKVFQTKNAVDDLLFLRDCSRRFKLKRFDLAIDLPISRNLVQLIKDHRKYSLTMCSLSDKSEYLGVRNSNGFVKLYNKTIESKLDRDITRLEITCGGDMTMDEISDCVPRLQFIPLQPELTLDSKLSEKDRLLVDLLKMHPEMFHRLNWSNRKKFQKYIFADDRIFVFNRDCVRKLLPHLNAFKK